MKTLPLRFTIAISYILLVLLTSITVLYLTYQSGKSDIQTLAGSLHSQTYASIQSSIDGYLKIPQDVNRVNLTHIQDGVLDIRNPERVKAHLLSEFYNYESLESMEYADENRYDFGPARRIFDAPLSFGEAGPDTDFVYRLYEVDRMGNKGRILWQRESYDPREYPWYKVAKEAGKPTWTPIYLWPNGDVGMDAVSPVILNNRFTGVIDSAITLKELADFLQEIKFTPNSEIYIIERSGLLVAGSDILKPYTQTGGDLQRLEAKNVGVEDLTNVFKYLDSNNIKIEDIAGEQQYFVDGTFKHYVTISPYRDEYGLDWLIILSTPESDLMANLISSRLTTTFILSLALFISVIIALLIALWITSPVSKLTEYAKKLAEGNWDQETNIKRSDEIGKLAESLTSMSADLKKKNQTLNEYTQQISSEKQKIEAVLKSMVDGVCVTDKDHNIILANRAFTKITGFSLEELTHISFDQLVSQIVEKSEDREKFRDISDMLYGDSGGVVYFDSVLLKSKNHKRTVISGVGSRFRNTEGQVVGVVILIRDITKLLEFEKMKESFVSLASHQLRTPLTGIKWSTSLLTKDKSLPENVKSLIEHVEKSNEKMISLVNGLLSVSRLESGKSSARKEVVAIKTILKNSLEEVRGILQKNHTKVVGLAKINKEARVLVDIEQFVQVFDNLFSNAATYSQPGKTITISISEKADSFVVAVEDRGMGIPKEQQARVFEKFYRASNVANLVPGTGLGLYFVKKVVEDHNGKVWFESKEDVGTTFYVEIPKSKSSGLAKSV